jgi:hypothetical protein
LSIALSIKGNSKFESGAQRRMHTKMSRRVEDDIPLFFAGRCYADMDRQTKNEILKTINGGVHGFEYTPVLECLSIHKNGV